MSVITLPRRPHTAPRDLGRSVPRSGTSRPGAHRAGQPRRNAVRSIWRGATPARRVAVIVGVAVAISLVGSMEVASRQVELHALQNAVLQAQSSYAEQVGSLTNVAAPGVVASHAGALHLVDPVTIIQVPSVPLDKPLPLPQFVGYAPVTSRTLR